MVLDTTTELTPYRKYTNKKILTVYLKHAPLISKKNTDVLFLNPHSRREIKKNIYKNNNTNRPSTSIHFTSSGYKDRSRYKRVFSSCKCT